MADASKAEKLASARKKFKELKKEKKKSAPVSKVGEESLPEATPPPSRDPTPVEKHEEPETEVAASNFFNVNTQEPPAQFFDSFHSGGSGTHSETINFFRNASPKPETQENIIEPIALAPEANGANVQTSHTFDPFSTHNNVLASNHVPPVVHETPAHNIQVEAAEKPYDFNSTLLQHQLEEKNYELALQLEQEKAKSGILSRKLDDYDHQLSKTNETSQVFVQEIEKLKQALANHTQTVEILVSEKTELATNLVQLQQSAKEKSSECDELQTRLRASRSRVSDLERELSSVKHEKTQSDHLGQEHSVEFEQLKETNRKLKATNEEMHQDLLEVTEKLKTSSEATLILQQQIAELSTQLSLANVKIQQLTTGDIDQVNVQVEQLSKEKHELGKQLELLQQNCKTLTRERDDCNIQYQQYIQQLNAQLSNLAGKCEQLQKENDTYANQEENRIKHISELERQLQLLQNENVAFTSQKSSQELKNELEASKTIIGKLEQDNGELKEDNTKLAYEKESALSELEKKIDAIKQLEDLVEQLKVNQPDTAKLLAVMESDKVAASRAVLQNIELKKQLENIEEVMLKLNQDKLELTEKLSYEQSCNKELLEKLQKTEGYLQSLADAVEIKDQELRHLRENSMELNKQMLQSEQLSDRLRHYEAQDHSSHSLQTELQETKKLVASLQADRQNVDELVRKIQQLELQNRELQKSGHTNGITVEENKGHDDNWNILDRESAMKHLEQKFMKTMEDIANLTEEKQRLEHLVLQLQGETETIGEYVALYQHQRKLLKQKAIEKDQQLSQLANDRELMKNKLERLNNLVRQLVLEKGTLPQELLEHHDNMLKEGQADFCEEHAKLNSEISKITQNVESGENVEHKSTETAEQIIALLSEIKSSNLVQPTENFHHCPWCSGQLITV